MPLIAVMDISIVIATHDQKERLALVLAGLRAQRFPSDRFEVIVVDDGCTDGTGELLEEAGREMPVQVVHLSPNQGRCRARNQGVAAAQGRRIAFLDGDALPHPDWLQSHWEALEQHGPEVLVCGMEYSLPELEYLQDPQTGTVVEEAPDVVRRYLRLHQEEIVVTEEMVCTDFERIHARARVGGYPFPELEQVQEQTCALFEQYPDSPIGWTGFYPHNGMVPRDAFEQVGGFDEGIPFSEGWDLAYRLQQAGIRPCFAPQARTYHLYHYHPFFEPERMREETAVRRRAIQWMAGKNQEPRLGLLHLWQAGLWPDPFLPEEWVLKDLIDFHHRYQEITPEELADLQILLQRHPVWGDGN